jgi:HAMP domain-containing protein
MAMSKGKNGNDTRFRKKRSRILYEITGLIIVVLVISGLATFLLVRSSQEKLIKNSIDKLIESEANDMASSLKFLTASEISKGTGVLLDFNDVQFLSDIAQKKMTDFQKKADQGMKEMIDTGFFGMEKYFILMISSDESMVYNWQAPEYLTDAIDAGSSYILMDNGIPEFGLEGSQLMIMISGESPLTPGFYYTHVSVIPMQEKIDSINAFYDQERKDVSLTLGLSVLFSILAVVIITFFVLNYLIRKRITESIDLLSSEAEEVMGGNLDIDIVVHQGGEFQGLEKTFKNMVESIRKLIAKSMDDS